MNSALGVRIICLETQGYIFEHSRDYLGHWDGANLVQSPATLVGVTKLARRSGPTILFTNTEFLNELPRGSVLNLCVSGTLQLMLVLKSKSEEDLAVPYIRQGCSGILYFDDPPTLWQKAVSTIAAGELWIPRSVMSRLLREMIQINTDPACTITRREAEILELIGLGHDNRSIANELFISKETVRWHLRSLYSKIGASDREGAIRYWRLTQCETATAPITTRRAMAAHGRG